MIHILLVHLLQLQSRSVLIYLVNVTLIAKSALHIFHFARRTEAAVYYTAVGLEKKKVTENREQTENRQAVEAGFRGLLLNPWELRCMYCGFCSESYVNKTY